MFAVYSYHHQRVFFHPESSVSIIVILLALYVVFGSKAVSLLTSFTWFETEWCLDEKNFRNLEVGMWVEPELSQTRIFSFSVPSPTTWRDS